MKNLRYFIYALIHTAIIMTSSTAAALVFPLPPKGVDVVGQLQTIMTDDTDDFHSISQDYNVGYYELVEANPGLNPDAIPKDTSVVIPSRFILPDAPREGIIVNLAELRLYYFPPGKNEVWTYPIGIGREGWLTPVCLTKVVSKKEKPTWIVPKSIHDDRAKQGVELPEKVSPGPDNPLGDYALRLGMLTSGAYLIHGTNDPSGVGRRSSSGCVRMFPEDIETLFKSVAVGTPVRILNNAYKIGWYYKNLYLEAHLPLQEQQAEFKRDLTPIVQSILTATEQNKDAVDWDKVQEIITDESGIPCCISQPKVIKKVS